MPDAFIGPPQEQNVDQVVTRVVVAVAPVGVEVPLDEVEVDPPGSSRSRNPSACTQSRGGARGVGVRRGCPRTRRQVRILLRRR